MAPTTQALLLQLGQPTWSSERHQLVWCCPLSQEEVILIAPMLMATMDCQVLAEELGADRLCWRINFEGVQLLLQFEALCERLWLEPSCSEGKEEMLFLAELTSARPEST